jgi:hypothetical protein
MPESFKWSLRKGVVIIYNESTLIAGYQGELEEGVFLGI